MKPNSRFTGESHGVLVQQLPRGGRVRLRGCLLFWRLNVCFGFIEIIGAIVQLSSLKGHIVLFKTAVL